MEKFPIDHDLHCHTALSACAHDDGLTAAYIVDNARRNGYATVAITDHFWDRKAAGASDWYAPQDLSHVRGSLPLPDGGDTQVIFGCETEFCGGKKIGITPENYNYFGMIVVPVNHFHMDGFSRPADCVTPAQVAELLVTRLEELCLLPLPWRRVGIPHLNGCSFPSEDGYMEAMMLADENRLRAAFMCLSKAGAGIELNAFSFPTGWRENETALLRLMRLAKEEGCRFYCCSDAHARGDLKLVGERLREVADVLSLTAGDLFTPE